MPNKKMTEARRRVLTKIIIHGYPHGVHLKGPEITLAHGFLAWGWCERRFVSRIGMKLYFPTAAGRIALDGAREGETR